ncbi:MAG: DUF938 domain-containing protein [Pseudomonadales bacterium]|nr:DUF938 domain-containing protein [Pseudomonadales bacterium]
MPFSQASENNKLPILEILQRHFDEISSVLEIGSGTAQHGEFFTQQFPRISWQCTDIPQNLTITQQRISACSFPNLPAAITLDVNDSEWKCSSYDSVFTANSLHIMSEESVVNFFAGIPQCLNKSAIVLLYGPFKYQGEFTTDSNARFDLWLKQQNPESGVRDFERIQELATAAGLSLLEDNSMPANNQLLVFKLN